MTSASGGKLHQRSAEQCRTPDCTHTPEPRDAYCIDCQLAGRVGELGRSIRQPRGRSVNGRSGKAQPPA